MDSAEKIEGCLDILTKILLRLPAKPLFRFKTVSKRWNSLISDRHFSTHWTPTVSGLFTLEFCSGFMLKDMYNYIPLQSGDVCWQNMRAHLQSIDYTDVQFPIIILDSIGGLFLCRYKSPVGHGFHYMICNHTTKKFTPLPDPHPHRSELYFDNINLAYDRSRSPHYKVIMVGEEILHGELQLHWHIKIQIYSSETKCWAPWTPDFSTPLTIDYDRGVFLNNAVYWPTTEEISSLYYDIDGESFNSFPMPPLPKGREIREIKHFGEAKGCLFMIVHGTPRGTFFDIHWLGKDFSSWSIKYRIDLDLISRTIGAHLDLVSGTIGTHGLRLMCALDQEDEEEMLLILYTTTKFIAYNPKDESFKKLCELSASKDRRYPLTRKLHYQFVENPFPLP